MLRVGVKVTSRVRKEKKTVRVQGQLSEPLDLVTGSGSDRAKQKEDEGMAAGSGPQNPYKILSPDLDYKRRTGQRV